MANASIQFKKHTSMSGRNKNTHILRNSTAYKNPNIIVLKNTNNDFSKPKHDTSTLDDTARKKELQSVNSSINTYQKRLLKIDVVTEPTRATKMQQKINELLLKREELKGKRVGETRGRIKEKDYFELELALTKTPPKGTNLIDAFIKVQTDFLQRAFFKGLELITNAVHIDQASIHSHALFKIPDGTTIDKHLNAHGGRDAYKEIIKEWHEECRKLEEILGKKLDAIKGGKRYLSLKNYKKATRLYSEAAKQNSNIPKNRAKSSYIKGGNKKNIISKSAIIDFKKEQENKLKELQKMSRKRLFDVKSLTHKEEIQNEKNNNTAIRERKLYKSIDIRVIRTREARGGNNLRILSQSFMVSDERQSDTVLLPSDVPNYTRPAEQDDNKVRQPEVSDFGTLEESELEFQKRLIERIEALTGKKFEELEAIKAQLDNKEQLQSGSSVAEQVASQEINAQTKPRRKQR